MAVKGDKAKLYDVAMRMYVEGSSLTEVEAVLGVSRQTLATWKADTQKPSEDLDEWDKAKKIKTDNIFRLRALWERELKALEESKPGSLNNVSMDALTKLGTLIQRWEQMEEAARQRQTAGSTYDKPAVFMETLEWLALQLKDTDPEGLKVLARNFDHLIIRFKAEHAQTA